MRTENNLENVKSWLLTVLKSENIVDLSLNIVGSSEKGDGYVGDIIFVQASGILENNQTKNYDLVLKCSKRSKALRENSPVKETFLNEIYVYKYVLPYFTQFQLDKGVKNIFKSFPKCYGTVVGDDYEIIVFENLKKNGYDLWTKKDPLTRRHLSLVLGEYAKHHATSLALQEQRPEEYSRLANGLQDVFKKFSESGNVRSMFENSITEVIELLQDEMDEKEILKFKNFKDQIDYILNDLMITPDGAKVLIHGDCWNNNFMYKCHVSFLCYIKRLVFKFGFQDNDKNFPSDVAIIDWQISKSSSPIFDLSYFLFACTSEEDLNDVETLLEEYYEKLTQHLKQLGSDSSILYPIDQFFKEWKENCKFGILMSSLIMKVCSTEKDEVVDLAEAADSGKEFADSFIYEIKDKTNLKKRMKPIIKYVVQNNLI